MRLRVIFTFTVFTFIFYQLFPGQLYGSHLHKGSNSCSSASVFCASKTPCLNNGCRRLSAAVNENQACEKNADCVDFLVSALLVDNAFYGQSLYWPRE